MRDRSMQTKHSRMLLGCGLLAVAGVTYASGQPDRNFGADGTLVLAVDTEMPFSNESTSDALIDHAGRVVVVGTTKRKGSSYSQGLIVRRLVGGHADDEFGSGGVVYLEQQNRGFEFRHGREQPDGKLLVAGATVEQQDFTWKATRPVVCRLLETGVLDHTGFGDGGCRTLETISARPGFANNGLRGFEVLPDGSIVVLGIPQNSDPNTQKSYALVRLNPDGSDDRTFGGMECPNPAPACAISFSPQPLNAGLEDVLLAVDKSSRPLVYGKVRWGSQSFLAVLRHDAAGVLDRVFDNVSMASITGSPTTQHDPVSILVDDSGSTLALAELDDVDMPIAIAKFDAEGKLAAGFGNGGRVALHPGVKSLTVTAMALDQHERLLVGFQYLSSLFSVAPTGILRLSAEGAVVDKHFGEDGVASLLLTLGIDSYPAAILPDDDHLLVVGGQQVDASADTNPYLARLDQDALFADAFEAP